MRIGLTYDLKDDYLRRGLNEEEAAEFDSPETIDAIASALTALGHEADRIGGVHSLARRLVAGDRWDLVFNIAEGLYGFGREAQVPALLDAYRLPYTFSDPLVLALCLHKGICKTVVAGLGVPTPRFAVLERVPEGNVPSLDFPLFVKPVAEGSSKGIDAHSRVDNVEELRAECADLLAKFHEPVLVESYLPGREFTVGILGTGAAATAIGVLEVMQVWPDSAYSYANKQEYESRVRYRLADDPPAIEARELALSAWRGLGCRDAGRIDFRCDASGRPSLLEVNPLAGLHPVHSDLIILGRLCGLSHADIIGRIVESALGRMGRDGLVSGVRENVAN